MDPLLKVQMGQYEDGDGYALSEGDGVDVSGALDVEGPAARVGAVHAVGEEGVDEVVEGHGVLAREVVDAVRVAEGEVVGEHGGGVGDGEALGGEEAVEEGVGPGGRGEGGGEEVGSAGGVETGVGGDGDGGQRAVRCVGVAPVVGGQGGGEGGGQARPPLALEGASDGRAQGCDEGQVVGG